MEIWWYVLGLTHKESDKLSVTRWHKIIIIIMIMMMMMMMIIIITIITLY